MRWWFDLLCYWTLELFFKIDVDADGNLRRKKHEVDTFFNPLIFMKNLGQDVVFLL